MRDTICNGKRNQKTIVTQDWNCEGFQINYCVAILLAQARARGTDSSQQHDSLHQIKSSEMEILTQALSSSIGSIVHFKRLLSQAQSRVLSNTMPSIYDALQIAHTVLHQDKVIQLANATDAQQLAYQSSDASKSNAFDQMTLQFGIDPSSESGPAILAALASLQQTISDAS